MVATASRTPARNDWRFNSATRQAAMSAATTTVNCCSKIPWATAKLPSVNARTLTIVGREGFHCRKHIQAHTVAQVNPTKNQRNTGCIARNGNLISGAGGKRDVNRISKTLLVGGVVGTRRVEWTAVISSLNVACNLGAIGIAVVQQKFSARATGDRDPTRCLLDDETPWHPPIDAPPEPGGRKTTCSPHTAVQATWRIVSAGAKLISGSAPMLQLTYLATADSHLGLDRASQRSFLLVFSETLSPGIG